MNQALRHRTGQFIYQNYDEGTTITTAGFAGLFSAVFMSGSALRAIVNQLNTQYTITIPDDYRMMLKKAAHTTVVKNMCNNPVHIHCYYIKAIRNTDDLSGSPSSPYYTPVLAWSNGEIEQGSTASVENYPLSDPRASRIFGSYFHIYKKETRRLDINSETAFTQKVGRREIPYRMFKDANAYNIKGITKWMMFKIVPSLAQQVTTGDATYPPSRVIFMNMHKAQVSLAQDYLPDKYSTFVNGKPTTGGTHEISTYTLNTDIGVANTTA